jgi:hypothetical protein
MLCFAGRYRWVFPINLDDLVVSLIMLPIALTSCNNIVAVASLESRTESADRFGS